MDGIVVHRLVERGEDAGSAGSDETLLDRRHGDHSLAKGEGQQRADFQDGEMVRNEARERGFGLKIGRMGFVDDARNVQHRRAQRGRFRRVVGEHLRIAHVDPWLDHERDDLAHRVRDSLRREGRVMQFEGPARRLGRSHRERVERFRLAARNGDLGSDNIDQIAAAGRFLRDGAKFCRAFGDRRFRQGAIVRAGHAGVEMDFREAGFDIGAHYVARFAQSLVRRPALPGIGPEMVASEDDPGDGDAFLASEPLDESPVCGGRHAGVAAVLVHLVAGGLDQDGVVADAMGGEHRAQRLRVRCAPGRDAAARSRAVIGDDRAPDVGSGHERFARKSSRAASELLPSIGPTFVTARAPAALARSIAWRKSNAPDAIRVTKVAQKQSPAPVGSRTSTLCAGKLARSPLRLRPSQPFSPFLRTT